MKTGKEKCEMLQSIRKQIAEQYGLNYTPTECNHEGDCAGTCPRCDADLKDLQEQLEAKGISNIEIDKRITEEIDKESLRLKEDLLSDDSMKYTEGISIPPEDLNLAGVHALEGDSMPFDNIVPIYDRKLYKKCYVAGIGFHDINDVWDELYVGAKLALVRDKNNKYDKNAVAVALADDYDDDSDDFDFRFILGYIPRKENEHIAMMLDLGWSVMFDCEICELNEHRPISERIQIAIYIKSKKNIERNTRIRSLSIDEEMLKKIENDLKTKGNTYFRWRCVPTWEHNLPDKDDNVLFINKRKKESILYIMHLIAIGDEAYPFVEDKEDLRRKDDCCHYVFTNVKGPVKLPNSELDFLDEEEINEDQPEIYLSQESTDLLNGIFDDLVYISK